MCVFVLILNISYFTPIQNGPITDEQKFSGKAWVNQVTSGIYDYLPKTAQIAPQGPANEYVDEIDPKDSFYTVSNGKKGSDWMIFDIHLSRDSKVTLSQLAFPEFKITDNGSPIDYSIEPYLGRLVVNLNTGDHRLMVQFIDTPIRTISNYISLISWLIIICYLSRPLWLRLIYKK